jgi:hypothetical protein
MTPQMCLDTIGNPYSSSNSTKRLLRPSPPSRIIPAREAWNQTASGDGIFSQRAALLAAPLRHRASRPLVAPSRRVEASAKVLVLCRLMDHSGSGCKNFLCDIFLDRCRDWSYLGDP